MPFFIMILNTEAHYKHRTLALSILQKALDDICPKFDNEDLTVKSQLIRERRIFFNTHERLIDKEWKSLEKEAQADLKKLERERIQSLSKIEKTRKTRRIEIKLQQLVRNRNKRIKYLKDKLAKETKILSSQLKTLKKDDKKFSQIQSKLEKITESINNKIVSATERYEKIIANTKNSDNQASVEHRVTQAKKMWQKKKAKLARQYEEREVIHENKRFELDQVRVAVESFYLHKERILHWCLVAGIPPKVCYEEAKSRLSLLGKNSPEIENVLKVL